MSKCSFDVAFDRPDRRYQSGEKVRGTASIRVNQAVKCRKVELIGYWKTHGRGNTASFEYFRETVYEGELRATESHSFPFEYDVAIYPWTYHGHHLNVDHYLKVRVDVPWAFDPKYETEILVEPGPATEVPFGGLKDPTQSQGAGGRIIATIVALIFIVVGVPLISLFGFGCIFVTIGLGLLYFCYRNMLAERRLGPVEFRIEPDTAGPGDSIDVCLAFTPRSRVPLNRLTIKVLGQESVVSGSGTNRTTHTHMIFEDERTPVAQRELNPGERFECRESIQLPETEAYSIDLQDNDLTWIVKAQLDIPRWPDWAETRGFVVAPPLAGNAWRKGSGELPPTIPESTAKTESKSASAIPAQNQAEVPKVELEPDPWDVPEPTSPPSMPAMAEHDSGSTPADQPLLAIAQQLANAPRFGNERDSILASHSSADFEAEVLVERTSSTYGVLDAPEHRRGQTLVGTLVGSDQRISIQLPESENETISEARNGSTWKIRGQVIGWDDLYDRIELRGRST